MTWSWRLADRAHFIAIRVLLRDLSIKPRRWLDDALEAVVQGCVAALPTDAARRRVRHRTDLTSAGTQTAHS